MVDGRSANLDNGRKLSASFFKLNFNQNGVSSNTRKVIQCSLIAGVAIRRSKKTRPETIGLLGALERARRATEEASFVVELIILHTWQVQGNFQQFHASRKQIVNIGGRGGGDRF